MKRKLEVGQVWVVYSTIHRDLHWHFEVVAKISTSAGVRCILLKHGTVPDTNGGVAVFTGDGSFVFDQTDPNADDSFGWYIARKSSKPAQYRQQKAPPGERQG